MREYPRNDSAYKFFQGVTSAKAQRDEVVSVLVEGVGEGSGWGAGVFQGG